MPIITKSHPHTDEDLDLAERRSRIEANRAARIASLWSTPILADAEVPIALRLPSSTWQLRKKMEGAPPLFSIGKRSYVRTKDLLEWMDRLEFIPRQNHLTKVG